MPTTAAPKQISIGRKNAIALAESGWWKTKTLREVAMIGVFTKELCLPFGLLHKSVEKTLGRPVFIHEFGTSFDAIAKDLLRGGPAPTRKEILALLPAGR